jgi:hypothetical protein
MEKMKPPCIQHKCKLRSKNKNNFICLKCEARSQYALAINGDKDAIKYLKTLDKSSVGVLGPEAGCKKLPSNCKSLTKKQRYELKYYELMNKRMIQRHRRSFNSFEEILHFLNKKYKIHLAIADELGVSLSTTDLLKKIFSLPHILTRAEARAEGRRYAKLTNA